MSSSNVNSGMKGFIGVNDITEDKGLWKALVAEFIGTFTLVCVGIFSIVQFSLTANHAMIAFAFGLIVATMAQVSLIFISFFFLFFKCISFKILVWNYCDNKRILKMRSCASNINNWYSWFYKHIIYGPLLIINQYTLFCKHLAPFR